MSSNISITVLAPNVYVGSDNNATLTSTTVPVTIPANINNTISRIDEPMYLEYALSFDNNGGIYLTLNEPTLSNEPIPITAITFEILSDNNNNVQRSNEVTDFNPFFKMENNSLHFIQNKLFQHINPSWVLTFEKNNTHTLKMDNIKTLFMHHKFVTNNNTVVGNYKKQNNKQDNNQYLILEDKFISQQIRNKNNSKIFGNQCI